MAVALGRIVVTLLIPEFAVVAPGKVVAGFAIEHNEN